MSDYEEDSGVHSQLQDERTDNADNEGMYRSSLTVRQTRQKVFFSFGNH